MARSLWKGAISFGLVHIPVALYPAAQESGIDFDWLDRRSMDPVGYKRVNKRTGREIHKDDIVRGIKQDSGDYIVLSDDQIKAAYPRTTQTIEIETFVKADQIAFPLLEKPYYLAPLARSHKVYALLREALLDAQMVGIARFVMHGKEHLCMLMPGGAALVLNTLRWAEEMRDVNDIDFPPLARSASGVKDAELKMAVALVCDMSSDWAPRHYENRFADAIHALVKEKLKAGDTEEVKPLEDAPAKASNVVDLTALLKQSIGQRKTKPAAKSPARKSATRKRA